MLTSSQCIVSYDFARRRVVADRLERKRDARYLRGAARMIAIYRQGIGLSRGELHGRVERVLDSFPDCPPRRVQAFCKLLDDLSSFAADSRSAASLRREVFTRAAASHPLVGRAEGIFESTVGQVRDRLANELGRSWEEIERDLFADVIELQRLTTFPDDLQAADLLAMYNVAQTQTLLYRATRVTVVAREDLKTILRHAKLAGLMHTIRRLDDGSYRFTLDGPASSLRSTSRYGIRFARMVPKLLSCRGWWLHATILGPKNQLFGFELSPADRLRSPLAPPAPFDSALEAEIISRWEASRPEGWTLERETEVLHRGQEVLTPDFVLRHRDHPLPTYVELVGYWTPEYLRKKAAQLAKFRQQRWILIVSRSNATFAEALQLPTLHLRGKFQPAELVRLALPRSW